MTAKKTTKIKTKGSYTLNRRQLGLVIAVALILGAGLAELML